MLNENKPLIDVITIDQYHHFSLNLIFAQEINSTLSSALRQIYISIQQAEVLEDLEGAKNSLRNAMISIQLTAGGVISYYYEALAIIKGVSVEEVSWMEHEHVQADVIAYDERIRRELEGADLKTPAPLSFFRKMIQRVLAVDDVIRKNKQEELKKIESIDKFFLQKKTDFIFDKTSPDDFETNYKKAYTKNLISIAEITKQTDIKNKTIYEFYSLVEYCKEKEKAYKKNHRK